MNEKSVDEVVRDILSDFGGSVPDIIYVFGGEDEDREIFVKRLSSRISSRIVEKKASVEGIYSMDLDYLNDVYV